MLSASYAIAADRQGSSQTNEPPGAGPSGRPSAVLAESECRNVWNAALNRADSSGGASTKGGASSNQSASSSQASPDDSGGMLSKNAASSYVANFPRVDQNKDDQISWTEFQEGCNKGWILAAGQPDNQGPSTKGQSSPQSGG
jgi:hypothetical protein